MVKVKKQKIRVRNKNSIFQGKRPMDPKAIFKFLIGLIVLAILGLGLVRLKYMFVDSDHFLIQGVDVKIYDESGALRNLSLKDLGDEGIIGANIFFVDLSAIKDQIEANHPEYKRVVVKRVLPNMLTVEGILRRAVAQIRSDRYYPVDREGVLLPDVVNFPMPDIPIITGLGTNLAKISKTKLSKYEEQNLQNAISLINEIETNDKLKKYRLKLVDITDPGNLTFFLEAINVEIKIGNSDFRDRFNVLATVMDQLGQDINNFKYIDLRFEDPIMGPK
ncbi:MAG: cell division protein FtsQ/DivIB [Candidatus Omnitrophica bacterium]|nr:cell division protein FtsQ/DivIB [Candidatus Omnitrophota bacterium]MBU4149816.1 cell division protein FtsQ/DivIB [Candidatus Omnitrophota bacterium]